MVYTKWRARKPTEETRKKRKRKSATKKTEQTEKEKKTNCEEEAAIRGRNQEMEATGTLEEGNQATHKEKNTGARKHKETQSVEREGVGETGGKERSKRTIRTQPQEEQKAHERRIRGAQHGML